MSYNIQILRACWDFVGGIMRDHLKTLSVDARVSTAELFLLLMLKR